MPFYLKCPVTAADSTGTVRRLASLRKEKEEAYKKISAEHQVQKRFSSNFKLNRMPTLVLSHE